MLGKGGGQGRGIQSVIRIIQSATSLLDTFNFISIISHNERNTQKKVSHLEADTSSTCRLSKDGDVVRVSSK